MKAAKTVPVQLVNDTDESISLPARHILGIASNCDVLPMDFLEDRVAQAVEGKVRTCGLAAHSSVPQEACPVHLENLLKRSTSNLQPDEALEVERLLVDYQDIFSKGSHEPFHFKRFIRL